MNGMNGMKGTNCALDPEKMFMTVQLDPLKC